MIVPKIKSFTKVLSKTKVPSKREKTRKAKIVKKKPMNSPLNIPLCFTFLSPKKTPKNMETPLITWLTGEIKLSEMLVNLKRNANSKISMSDVQRAAMTPFIIGFII